MLSKLLNPLPYKSVIIIIVSLICIIVCSGFYIRYQNKEINELNNKLIALEITRQNERLFYITEQEKARIAINDQNKIISEFLIDSKNYEYSIQEQEKILLEKNIKKDSDIQNKLDKDNSIDNQFKIISSLLKEFSDEN